MCGLELESLRREKSSVPYQEREISAVEKLDIGEPLICEDRNLVSKDVKKSKKDEGIGDESCPR